MSRPIATISSFRFDTSGWKPRGQQHADRSWLWETGDGDAVLLYFLNAAPDLPRCSSVQQLRDFYAHSLKSSKTKIVECGIIELADHPAVSLVLKAPQVPSGFMYEGVFTLPFRDFSFVVKVQCLERGPTGLREAIIFEERIQAGEKPDFINGVHQYPDWNPDLPDYDKDFPTHPISRVRRLLREIAKSASLDDEVRQQPGFAVPNT
jgi:hypothetical protein